MKNEAYSISPIHRVQKISREPIKPVGVQLMYEIKAKRI